MKVMNLRLVRASRRIDWVWRLIAWMFVNGESDESPIRSILVVDLHLVGDIVMLLPFLSAVRDRHPDACITLVAGPWAEAIIAGERFGVELVCYQAPWVKEQRLWPAIVGFLRLIRQLRATPWDVGVDVRGDIRQILLLCLSGCRKRIGFDFTGGGSLLTDVVQDDGSYRHLLDHHERLAARLGAWNGTPFIPSINLTDRESRESAGDPAFIGFHFGASLALRRLPANDAALLIRLHVDARGHLVVFAPPDLDDYLAEVRQHLPSALLERLAIWQGDLRAFIVKTSRASRMFVMDSGPAHIAAALGRETIVFFGPNLPAYTGPRGRAVRVVEDEGVACRPCDQHHCTNKTYQACMIGVVAGYAQTLISLPTTPSD